MGNWKTGLVKRAGNGVYRVEKAWAHALRWVRFSVKDSLTTDKFGDDIFVTISTVTPVMAELMLQDSMANRRLKPSGLAKIRRQLEKEMWIFNAVPLLFTQAGQLGDGQHRAKASVLSDIPFDTLMVIGVAEDAIVRTVDTNVARNAGDRLEIGGMREAKLLASTTRLIHSWLQDDPSFRSVVSDQEIMDYVTADERILGAVQMTRRERNWTGILTPSVVSFVRYVLSENDGAECERFLEKLRTGVNITSQLDPVGQLRQQLINRRARKQRLTPSVVIPLVFKAWNLVRDGRTVQTLRPDGGMPRLMEKAGDL